MASLVSLATDFTAAQIAVTGVSDNLFNCFAVLRFLTSAFSSRWMDLKWDNRDNNKLADALTNVFFVKTHLTTSAVYARRALLYNQVGRLRGESRQSRKAKSGPRDCLKRGHMMLTKNQPLSTHSPAFHRRRHGLLTHSPSPFCDLCETAYHHTRAVILPILKPA